MLGRLARSAVIFGLCGLFACYSPPEPDCGFICGSGGSCPDDYTCASDNICHRNGSSPTLMCKTSSVPFDVQSVTANGSHEVDVTFDSEPNATQAADPANYTISGLTIEGTPTLAGATVKLMTSAQASVTYTLTVANVTRASDGETLTTAVGTFAGVAAFVVASATSVDAHTMRVTFSAAPNASQAADPASYAFDGGLTVTGTPALSGSSVTVGTSTQAAQTYTVTVTNVKRASDFEPLDTNTAMFTGRTPFAVASAASTSNTTMTVTFSDPPDMTLAMTLGNYTVSGLTLSGTPSLSGSTVTLTTASQSATSYTVQVANVTRASDMEPLDTSSATFTGTSTFDVVAVSPTKNTEVQVKFSDPPDPTAAANASNYTFDGGLTASGTPVVAGRFVTLTTSAQAAQMYTLTVANVTRMSDGAALTTTMATFTGVTCSDTMLNGDETDTDCGGSVCAACANGKMCLVNADCQSNNCSGTVCAP